MDYLNVNKKAKDYLNEHFELIGTYQDISVYDTNHAISQFEERFPTISINILYKCLNKGIRKILKRFDTIQNNYMIISYKHGLRLPLEIRLDRYSKKIIGTLATVLTKDQEVNLRKEIEIMIEQKGDIYYKESLCEGFSIYTENFGIFTDFEYIIL